PKLIKPTQVTVIYRGIDETGCAPGFRPDEKWLSAWNAEYPQLAGRPVITLPGRLTRLKGHAGFFRILESLRSRHPDIHGLVVGGTDPRRTRYAEELRQIVRDRQLESLVTFTGHRHDVNEILSVSRVAVSLSSNPPEAFGRTVVEA